MSSPATASAPRAELTLFDTATIIVGIIIGSGVYESSPKIAGCVTSVSELFGIWLVGALFAMVGALCYAELATTYPREGGDYVFLNLAFGRGVGFVFAWMQLWVVRPGSIGAMAYVFGAYANKILPGGAFGPTLYALAAIVGLTAINISGVKAGKWTQDVLTVIKVIGLTAVIALGALSAPAEVVEPATLPERNWNLALILVFFAYGGWNEMAYVAAEVRDPQRNIVRALIGGTLTVALFYLGVNYAMVHALGLAGIAWQSTAAARVVEHAIGSSGGNAVSLLIAISTLGAMNGITFTGSRIYSAMGRDHRLFAALARWHPRWQTPVNSFLTEAAITIGTILLIAVVHRADRDQFERLVIFTAPLFWGFLFLTGLALIVLRSRDAMRPRSFRVPLYPVTPLAFMAGCAFMVYSSTTYAWANSSYLGEALWSLSLLVIGIAWATWESFLARRD